MPRNFTILDFIDWTKKHGINIGDELGITCNSDPELGFITYKNITIIPNHAVGGAFPKLSFVLCHRDLRTRL